MDYNGRLILVAGHKMSKSSEINPLIERAVKHAGSQKSLSMDMNSVTPEGEPLSNQNTIHRLLTNKQPVDPHKAIWIHMATKGKVTFDEFFPKFRKLLAKCK